MNILLINTNPVVSRLISLCMREDNTVLEEITEVSAARLDSYDIIFVDDASCVDNVRQLLQNMTSVKKVLLLGNNILEDLTENFDEVIKKPFLPSDIRSAIAKLYHAEEKLEETADAHFIFPLSTEEEREDEGGFRIIGQHKNSYIIASMGDDIVIVDQHAAHERILYTRISKELEGKGVAVFAFEFTSALCLSDMSPVGGSVGGPGEAFFFDKGLE